MAESLSFIVRIVQFNHSLNWAIINITLVWSAREHQLRPMVSLLVFLSAHIENSVNVWYIFLLERQQTVFKKLDMLRIMAQMSLVLLFSTAQDQVIWNIQYVMRIYNNTDNYCYFFNRYDPIRYTPQANLSTPITVDCVDQGQKWTNCRAIHRLQYFHRWQRSHRCLRLCTMLQERKNQRHVVFGALHASNKLGGFNMTIWTMFASFRLGTRLN